VRRLAKTEAGFGLIELLIAMTVMVIAIMAIVAAFSSGMVTLNRASRASTAATLADKQMEAFRRGTYASVVSSTGTPQTGPDGRTYRVDSAVQLDCAIGTPPACTGSRPVKRVTVVVYDLTTPPATELFRESSTFDQATG
jgi:type II secretory pathway pseudopilin PulG